MQLHRQLPFVAGAIFLLLLFAAPSHAHNITRLLKDHPAFSTFNHYLTLTHLADEINSRTTITVCAIDNDAMSELLASHPSISTVKNVLSLHVLLDYFGAKKLHQITNGTALAATLFQATGSAPGSAGFVNITDLKGGRISGIIPSDVAAAPTPAPSEMNITSLMSAHGCKAFADTLLANPDAMKTYQDNAEGGVTVFCPLDDPFKAFLPKYKNLTAAGKTAFLEFLAVPMYLSMSMLKSNNGPMNTLATDGASKYDFTVQNEGEEVTLKTKVNTVKITGTLLDEQPLAVYSTDKVLLPKELFKATAAAPAPAPAPEVAAADSPKASKKKKAAPEDEDTADSPADSPNADVADATADGNDGGLRLGSGRGLALVVLGLWLGLLLV
ncbi:hypothetical protein CRG98_029095 [Punica granatum]|uniref:FAS1 domain-containing protein n=1 Tax=Punica granatum TaxID=22663 RepID=A0A2I0J3I0_PUNGR|nr:hypothetical protein CRG98_029095 [Punica granatum]